MPAPDGWQGRGVLTDEQVEDFVRDGYVAIRGAFSSATAAACRDVLWAELATMGIDRDAPSTWDRPVVRLGEHGEEPFREAATSPLVSEAADRLAGRGRWAPRVSLDTFPVRFPSEDGPGDDGWHIDASFPGDIPDAFMHWRVNLRSKGRALLMLFLFSDIGDGDAPTRLRVGSHRRMAALLRPYGDDGAAMGALIPEFESTAGLPETAATGSAGDVYLCHPFLVHAAQPLLPGPGRGARFLAQPVSTAGEI
ncbi:phytanoyl-CoA dioxygenase [Tsukamurella pseudospumae]|uniref:Phytanoyl-CoA dioxygenase n=1 Tax=Tsukamurella pseudospumae TaxID=239498 RepID=A0A137ZN56_9ACTN|nr:phytanoyl-CoA dioxygenase [Tsukamurella pseudospumae]